MDEEEDNGDSKEEINIYSSRFNKILGKVISDKTWKPLYKEDEEEE